MTALNHIPGSGQDLGGLERLPGLNAVTGQLEPWFAVVRAEQARRQAGATITRPAWKNLVFTGGGGAGKSRTAEAVARRTGTWESCPTDTSTRSPPQTWSAPPRRTPPR